jgi:2-dehydropantoate 2-reductase
MQIAVMGAGAVGAYFGAKLASAGHEVTFIARGKHLKAMRSRGLEVRSPGNRLHIANARFTDNPGAAGIVDLILFCVKSYDTETAAQAISPMVGAQTAILSLQNGIDNPEKIAARWGGVRTLTGVVYVGAAIAAPGVVAHSTGGRILFGPFDGKVGRRARDVQRILSAAGIPCDLRQAIEKVQWTKLLWNAPFCAISCLARANVKQIVASAPLTRLALDCMVEVRAAARTRGIELPRRLCDEAIAFSKGLGAFKPSMLQDLEAGKPLEYEAFNGIVIKQLEQAGCATPVNQSFYALLRFLDERIREEAKH